jgi:hypothetical protein
LDPILQFLTRSARQKLVPLPSLQKTIPPPLSQKILQVQASPVNDNRIGDNHDPWKVELRRQWNQAINDSNVCNQSIQAQSFTFQIGFPSGMEGSETTRKLCGSTKTAAKR